MMLRYIWNVLYICKEFSLYIREIEGKSWQRDIFLRSELFLSCDMIKPLRGS
jgi:hypothetical protein